MPRYFAAAIMALTVGAALPVAAQTPAPVTSAPGSIAPTPTPAPPPTAPAANAQQNAAGAGGPAGTIGKFTPRPRPTPAQVAAAKAARLKALQAKPPSHAEAGGGAQ